MRITIGLHVYKYLNDCIVNVYPLYVCKPTHIFLWHTFLLYHQFCIMWGSYYCVYQLCYLAAAVYILWGCKEKGTKRTCVFNFYCQTLENQWLLFLPCLIYFVVWAVSNCFFINVYYLFIVMGLKVWFIMRLSKKICT